MGNLSRFAPDSSNRLVRNCLATLRIFGAALLLTLFAAAQTNRGSLNGTIKDPTDAVIGGASVTITNLNTNETRRLKTSESGFFTALDLEPVSYRVEVVAAGFKRALVDGVKVDTGNATTINLSLQTGAVETQIVVEAEAVTVNTESGTTGSIVSQREIRDVPLVNRSVLDLAVTLPNVSGDPGSENPAITASTACPGCNLSVNGGRPLNTLLMADGTNNTGVSLGRTMVSFSPETVQEFSVQTSAYSAEYSSTGGGVISATTKSGSNTFTGTALWYNRNPAAAAAPWTMAPTNRPYPTLKSNQFALTAGGPIYIPKIYNGKNKTFWFAALEPNYRRDRLDQYGLLPNEAMRGGDFSGLVNTPSGWLPQSVVDRFRAAAPNAVTASDSLLYNHFGVANSNQFTLLPAPATGQTYTPFPNNVIPKSLLDPTAVKALSYLTAANDYYVNSNGLISNVLVPRALKQDEKRFTTRIDHVFSAANRINGRYTTTPLVKIQSATLSPLTNAADYSWARQAMLADTHIFTPTLFNDLRLNYTRGRFSSTTAPEYDANTGANLNAEFGLPNVTKGGVPAFTGLFPGSSIGGGGSTATGIGQGGSTNIENVEERYAITDIVYKAAGNKSWKFGIDISHSLQNVTPLFAALGGQYAFSNIQTNSSGASTGTGGAPFASYLLGVPNGNVTLRNALMRYYYRWNYAAGFVQNDWKVRPNFTLNLGMRYNLQLPRTEKYDNQGVFRLDLAKEVALPTPLTLAGGRVVTSTLVPPFVFSGHGNSRYLTPADYLNFEPRFGFAWSPNALRKSRMTVRGGYGLSHAPNTGSFRLPTPDFSATSTYATTVPSSTANPSYMMRLGSNPPLLIPQTPAQVVSAPSSGRVDQNSLYYQQGIGGFAVSQNYHTPYIQSWNFTINSQLRQNMVLEVAYVGLKGTHLFLPAVNVNPKDTASLNAQIAANVNTTGTINDPLGRLNPGTGRVLTVQNGSLGSPYLGFSTLNQLYDSSSNSIRHGGYVSLVHRMKTGLTFTTNYTFAKSIDDSSSSGGDKNVLSSVGGAVGGQVAFGGARYLDRSVSTFDQKHVLNGTFLYDLPFGRGRKLLNTRSRLLDTVVGDWTLTGIVRMSSGFPYVPALADANLIGDLTHSARPDVTPGVSLINPLWTRDCPTGAGCQPYVNPAAFSRPALGQLGNAPRTLDGVRGPWARNFDLSVQKTFKIGEGRRRIQLRVDALNAFNHPVFRVFPNNAGGTDFMNQPTTTAMTAADYNTWASANGKPLAATAEGTALLNQINANVNAQRNAQGVLPNNFFSVRLPENFYGKQPANFDITNLDGYKLFRLRQTYNTSFGNLYSAGLPRYVQFGLKFFF